MTQTHDLSHTLRAIGLDYTANNLSDLLARATKKNMAHTQFLEHIATLEEKERTRKGLERRHARSKLGRFKPMADFDWGWPKKLDRHRVEAALGIGFLHAHHNVVLVAPQGLGKTMIAKNIVHNAILAGYGALFITAADMLLDLTAQESARALERRLKYYARIGCLCIDEIGYLSYDNRNADLLFRVITMRYETKSVILTTNLPFKEWPSIFPGAACTTALIDRVVHHADVISIEGDSYRLREAQGKRGLRRRASKP